MLDLELCSAGWYRRSCHGLWIGVELRLQLRLQPAPGDALAAAGVLTDTKATEQCAAASAAAFSLDENRFGGFFIRRPERRWGLSAPPATPGRARRTKLLQRR